MVDAQSLPNMSAPPDLRSKRAYPGIDVRTLEEEDQPPSIFLRKQRAIQDPVHGLIAFDDPLM